MKKFELSLSWRPWGPWTQEAWLAWAQRVAAEDLCGLDLACTVRATVSACAERSGAARCPELGVVVDLHHATREDVLERAWPALRDRFGLVCAHVHERGRGFNGCVLDFARPTLCPHASGASRRRRRRCSGARSWCAATPAAP